jgi:asparagine synthetase B (glutamine-hydrolysing)
MQEAELRRQMKQERRDAAALEPKQLQCTELPSNLESVVSVVSLKELSIAESHASHAEVVEAAPRESKQNGGRGIRSEQEDESLKKSIHHSTVAKNRQKQLQQWAAARPTVPITSSYFTSPLGAALQPQLSPTRVLLSGLGADELCGGYARYRTAHRHGGDSAARASMKADVDRIWLRNLGRDDRFHMLSNCFSMRTAH